jgi:hypothetical protein
MKILLWELNAKADREDIFNLTIGNENLHEISNDNAVRIVNFAMWTSDFDRHTTAFTCT